MTDNALRESLQAMVDLYENGYPESDHAVRVVEWARLVLLAAGPPVVVPSERERQLEAVLREILDATTDERAADQRWKDVFSDGAVEDVGYAEWKRRHETAAAAYARLERAHEAARALSEYAVGSPDRGGKDE